MNVTPALIISPNARGWLSVSGCARAGRAIAGDGSSYSVVELRDQFRPSLSRQGSIEGPARRDEGEYLPRLPLNVWTVNKAASPYRAEAVTQSAK